MTNWNPHTLFTFGGVLNTNQAPAEIWQCGVRVAETGLGGALADPDAFLADLVTPMHDWFANNGMQKFPTSATLDWLKAAQIGANGKYSDTFNHVHDYSTPVAGTGAAAVPDILTLAISWVTGTAVRRGSYASHGRIYPPLYTVAPASDGSIRSSSAANTLLLGSDLLAKINAVTQNCIPVVASGHGGELRPITGVRVGDVMDVQRKRKDAVKETYVTAAFP